MSRDADVFVDSNRRGGMDPDETAEPVRDPEGAPPGPLGDAVKALIERRGWEARLEGAQIHDRWEEIAGEQLARHTEPVRLVGGVLVLRVADPGWATQVRYLATELTARANRVLGDSLVDRVTVVTGRRPAGL